MRKIVFISIIFILFFLINRNESYISEDSIRFRVIANSNSPRDILMKELVVDELSSILFKSYDIDSTRDNIISNLGIIEEKIDELFINNDYMETYNIVYGMNEFPEKEHNGVIYEEGLYESLVVEIGSGEGNNYWCFLYPSLCMVDFDNNTYDENNVIYKSKIFELFNDFF